MHNTQSAKIRSLCEYFRNPYDSSCPTIRIAPLYNNWATIFVRKVYISLLLALQSITVVLREGYLRTYGRSVSITDDPWLISGKLVAIIWCFRYENWTVSMEIGSWAFFYVTVGSVKFDFFFRCNLWVIGSRSCVEKIRMCT